MAYEARDNSGTLGRNERREKDTQPEYTGKCVIDGKWHWISAWVKESGSDGDIRKFFSLSFKPIELKTPQKPASKPSNKPLSEMDDDIPF